MMKLLDVQYTTLCSSHKNGWEKKDSINALVKH